MKRKFIAALVGVASLALIAPTGAFAGEPEAEQPPIVDGLAGPLQFAVDASPNVPGRRSTWRQNLRRPAVAGRRGDAHRRRARWRDRRRRVSGSGRHLSTHTSTARPGAAAEGLPGGTPTVVADLGEYEESEQPRRRRATYGFVGIDDECLDQLPTVPRHRRGSTLVRRCPAPASGSPSATARSSSRTCRQRPSSRCSTVGLDLLLAATGGSPWWSPEELADRERAFGSAPWPSPTTSAAGTLTDIEVGTDGSLVRDESTCPGGPEDPGAGAPGACPANPGRPANKTQLAGGIAGGNEPGARQGRHDLRHRAFGNRISRASKRRPRAGAGIASPPSSSTPRATCT